MTITPISRQRLSAQIYMQLQKFLSEGNFHPGDRLPSERELAQALNVSRNSLREAFRVLEILGLIEIIPGSGTYIRKTNDDIILPLAMALSVENNSVKEIMEVRLSLEISGAKLAAQRRTQEDLIHIEKTLEDMKSSVGNIKDWLKADMRFHYQIVKAASNPLMLRLYYTIADSLTKAMDVAAHIRFKSDKEAFATLDEHITIFTHVKEQNVSLAAEAMLSHLTGVYHEIVSDNN